MHPFLARPRLFLGYLLLWLGIAAVPWVLIHSTARFGSLLLSAVSTLSFALSTLPVWYLCRTLPLRPGKLWPALSVHAAAAALWSVGFVTLAQLLAEACALIPAWRTLPDEVRKVEGALIGVGAVLYLLLATIHYVLAEIERGRVADEREAVLALAAQRAELGALRAQVHPHFLFNSLNTVSALIGYDPAKARDACLLLAEYLRGTLGVQERPVVALHEEWSLCERYLAVEALRLGERLQVEVAMEAGAEDCEIPSLLLQPLVENAVTHGIAPVEEPQPLRIQARYQSGRLSVLIQNGLDPAPRRKPGGLGLANVRARLFGQYGDDATLRVEREAGQFTIWIDLPARAPLRPEPASP